MNPPASHRATTAHLQAVYPFVSEGGLGGSGPLIGRDLLGDAFRFDPWDLYRSGALTNPNVVVVGQIGRGKSSLIKTMVWRLLAFGRRAWIVDPKGEYGPLAQACGSEPIRLQPGGEVRLNPLDIVDAGETGPGDQVVRLRTDLVGSLVGSSLGRQLSPGERTAVELAVRAASAGGRRPTLRDVVAALLDPDGELASTVRTDALGLADEGRAAALELRRLVDGDLSGMFDGPTSAGLDLGSSVVTLDLSAVFSSPALPVLMTCATAWLQAVLAAERGAKRLVVVDEAWAILRDLSTARWLQSTFKLSRSLGVANLAVVHRLSDLRAVGADGSAEQRLAEGLLADSETRVVFGQAPSEADVTRRLLGLTTTERDLITQLPRGVALWKVGQRSFLVEHAIGPAEATLVDTDGAMRENPRQFEGIPTESLGTEG
ncbi:MAG TPA: ATP-binding protein [Acidimicrobiales bacterium]|nr:ATP-binding protein [Acidimicrobiales bacterium]